MMALAAITGPRLERVQNPTIENSDVITDYVTVAGSVGFEPTSSAPKAKRISRLPYEPIQ